MTTTPIQRTHNLPRTQDGLPQCPEHPSAKQQSILTAATSVFLREGFERASVDTIAAEANVSKRTIYNYFADKRELYLAVIGNTLDPAPLNAALDPDQLRGPDSFRADLEAIGQRVIDTELQDEIAALRRVLIADVVRFPELTATCRQVLYPEVALAALGARLADLAGGRVSDEEAVRAVSQLHNLLTAQAQAKSAFWSLPIWPEKRAKIVSETVDLIVRAYRLED
jgi:TetR/AcrR family transcriptional repressor of mexJK operon